MIALKNEYSSYKIKPIISFYYPKDLDIKVIKNKYPEVDFETNFREKIRNDRKTFREFNSINNLIEQFPLRLKKNYVRWYLKLQNQN
ncbi:MAG: hypothetical protein GF317_16935 [Candidatus Lokiarchaeota archaeon]|nr:hypothetical protein [Candidatus Lokiarchaeota archaeon]MBD3201204.1 hypothetical protein [Candidatus Lokiarchaeota archaeon]